MAGYKRNYKKRNYKKNSKKKTFSRFNTYKNRSAKSQAYQIYKLNKKVNYINKKNSPEIHNWQCVPQDHQFNNMNTLNTHQCNLVATTRYGYIDGNFGQQNYIWDFVGDQQFNCKRIKIWGTVHKELDTTIDKYGFNGPLFVRLAVVQARGSKVIDVSDYIASNQTTGDMSQIFNPVQKGLTKDWVILYDHVYKSCRDDTYMFNFKISVKPKYRKIQKLMPVVTGSPTLEHQIYLLAMCYYDVADTDGTATGLAELDYTYRIYFTDD